MKKPGVFILLLFTGMLAAFTTGFYFGRNANNKEITVSFIEATYSTETTEEPQNTTVEIETTVSPALTPDGKLDLNLASKEDLMTVPGIGDATATLILNYRESHGPFTSIEELTNISGIGEKKVEALSDFVTVIPE